MVDLRWLNCVGWSEIVDLIWLVWGGGPEMIDLRWLIWDCWSEIVVLRLLIWDCWSELVGQRWLVWDCWSELVGLRWLSFLSTRSSWQSISLKMVWGGDGALNPRFSCQNPSLPTSHTHWAKVEIKRDQQQPKNFKKKFISEIVISILKYFNVNK